jgi:hypothetical protein
MKDSTFKTLNAWCDWIMISVAAMIVLLWLTLFRHGW